MGLRWVHCPPAGAAGLHLYQFTVLTLIRHGQLCRLGFPSGERPARRYPGGDCTSPAGNVVEWCVAKSMRVLK